MILIVPCVSPAPGWPARCQGAHVLHGLATGRALLQRYGCCCTNFTPRLVKPVAPSKCVGRTSWGASFSCTPPFARSPLMRTQPHSCVSVEAPAPGATPGPRATDIILIFSLRRPFLSWPVHAAHLRRRTQLSPWLTTVEFWGLGCALPSCTGACQPDHVLGPHLPVHGRLLTLSPIHGACFSTTLSTCADGRPAGDAQSIFATLEVTL